MPGKKRPDKSKYQPPPPAGSNPVGGKKKLPPPTGKPPVREVVNPPGMTGTFKIARTRRFRGLQPATREKAASRNVGPAAKEDEAGIQVYNPVRGGEYFPKSPPTFNETLENIAQIHSILSRNHAYRQRALDDFLRSRDLFRTVQRICGTSPEHYGISSTPGHKKAVEEALTGINKKVDIFKDPRKDVTAQDVEKFNDHLSELLRSFRSEQVGSGQDNYYLDLRDKIKWIGALAFRFFEDRTLKSDINARMEAALALEEEVAMLNNFIKGHEGLVKHSERIHKFFEERGAKLKGITKEEFDTLLKESKTLQDVIMELSSEYFTLHSTRGTDHSVARFDFRTLLSGGHILNVEEITIKDFEGMLSNFVNYCNSSLLKQDLKRGLNEITKDLGQQIRDLDALSFRDPRQQKVLDERKAKLEEILKKINEQKELVAKPIKTPDHRGHLRGVDGTTLLELPENVSFDLRPIRLAPGDEKLRKKIDSPSGRSQYQIAQGGMFFASLYGLVYEVALYYMALRKPRNPTKVVLFPSIIDLRHVPSTITHAPKEDRAIYDPFDPESERRGTQTKKWLKLDIKFGPVPVDLDQKELKASPAVSLMEHYLGTVSPGGGVTVGDTVIPVGSRSYDGKVLSVYIPLSGPRGIEDRSQRSTFVKTDETTEIQQSGQITR